MSDLGGRPTLYRPEYDAQAAKLAELGATDADLAEFFGVNVTTIWRWSGAHEGFCKSLKDGKAIADAKVERSLYHKAIGYTFDSEKVFQYEGEVIRAKTVEHVPPSDTAAIFWLKNRKPKEWRDKIEHEHSGVQINITRLTDAAKG